jgi:hypothetical protein
MREDSPDFFRDILKKFKAADDLLSKQLQHHEEAASAQKAELLRRVKIINQAASECWHHIQEDDTSSIDLPTHSISPQIDGEYEALKKDLSEVQTQRLQLCQTRARSQELERELQEALDHEQGVKIRRRRVTIGLIATLIFSMVFLHFWLLKETELRFEISVDGKSGALDTAVVILDGKPFSVERNLWPGRHELLVRIKNVEPFQTNFWSLYGKHDLGVLSLESSKGTLYVKVIPSPAKIILQQEEKIVLQTNAPLELDQIPAGIYTLRIQRDNYEESHLAEVRRHEKTDVSVQLNLGTVDISSVPSDAEFALTGDARTWKGQLPSRITDVPVGTYQVTASRGGWVKNRTIHVTPGNVSGVRVEFDYASISVASEPSGMTISTNGSDIGRTPLVIRELVPSDYTLTATDGENDLQEVIRVGPKETTHHTFVFRYGLVSLSSEPPGAAVLRKGKEVGRTPLTLARIPAANQTTIELRLDGYLSTNVPIMAQEGAKTTLTVKLQNKRFVSAVIEAQRLLDEKQYMQATKAISAALQIESNDSHAIALQEEITRQAVKEQKGQKEAARVAGEERAKAVASKLASVPTLDTSALLNDCWNATHHEDGGVGRAAAVPVELAINAIFRPFDLSGRKTKEVSNRLRFDMGRFRSNWQGKTVSFKGVVDSVERKSRRIKFNPKGDHPRNLQVEAVLNAEFADEIRGLKKGEALTVAGEMSDLNAPQVLTLGVNRLTLTNSWFSNTSPELHK